MSTTRRPGDSASSPRRSNNIFTRKPPPSPARSAGKLSVRSHHRLSPQRPKIEPAPDCFPEGTRLPITVQIKGWRSAITCNVVRMDLKTKQILVSLPDSYDGRHHADSGDQAVIGWPGHEVWHESRSAVSAKMKPGSRFVWLRLTSTPIHHERRRYVRAKHVRPVAIHKGRSRVEATSMDISEAAIRLVMNLREPVHSGDKVHVMFSTSHRFRGETVPLGLDGHVFRTRELADGQSGRKEVVIFFEDMTPAMEDFVRGLVYDLHLQDKRPVQDD